MNGITALIPTHPHRNRNGMLRRAVASVMIQTVQPDYMLIVNDLDGAGSAVTRNRGLAQVRTEWVAFLDSDDEWDPQHLEVLCNHIDDGNDGVLYSGCRVIDVLGRELERREEWGRFGLEFDGDLLLKKSYIPVTSMVRTSAIEDARASFHPVGDTDYDDWGFYLDLLVDGVGFKHVPEVTWTWHHHNSNTSGRADKGDAR